jgi:hypothetical protein
MGKKKAKRAFIQCKGCHSLGHDAGPTCSRKASAAAAQVPDASIEASSVQGGSDCPGELQDVNSSQMVRI